MLKKKGQNLIEFVFVMPILVIFIFGIIELAMFWRAATTVQNIAVEMASNAANQFVLDNQTSTSTSDIDCSDGSCYNLAVAKALNILQKKEGSLSENSLSFNCTNPSEYGGSVPYALYKCESTETASNSKPVMTLYVDYRNPTKNGVVVQLLYQYNSIFKGMSFSLFGRGEDGLVVLIPSVFEISSTKVQQYIGN